MTLKITEIFQSVQGEGPHTGRIAVFVRLGMCNFRCSWCDTTYSFDNFRDMTEDEILSEISKYASKYVIITGGEPFLQDLTLLLQKLKAAGYFVACETNGSLAPDYLEYFDLVVISPKGPSAGQYKNSVDKVVEKSRAPVLKIVIANDGDIKFAQQLYERFREIPFYAQLEWSLASSEKERLVEKMKQYNEWVNDVHIRVQEHKVIFGERPGV